MCICFILFHFIFYFSFRFSLLSWLLFLHIEAETTGRHFEDDIFKYTFFNENIWISIEISLKFVAMGLINNVPPLVQIVAFAPSRRKAIMWTPMLVCLPTHICVTPPQWVIEINIIGGGVEICCSLFHNDDKSFVWWIMSYFYQPLCNDVYQNGYLWCS